MCIWEQRTGHFGNKEQGIAVIEMLKDFKGNGINAFKKNPDLIRHYRIMSEVTFHIKLNMNNSKILKKKKKLIITD
jgi:hypothetical protein